MQRHSWGSRRVGASVINVQAIPIGVRSRDAHEVLDASAQFLAARLKAGMDRPLMVLEPRQRLPPVDDKEVDGLIAVLVQAPQGEAWQPAHRRTTLFQEVL